MKIAVTGKTWGCVGFVTILSSRTNLVDAASVGSVGEENEGFPPAVAKSRVRRSMVLTHENVADGCTQDGMALARCVHSSSYASGDLGVRFNKFEFLEETLQPANWTPLTLDDYPIQGETANSLKHGTTAISVVTEDDHQFIHDCRMTAHEYIMASGGYPTMPNSDSKHAYWAEFDEVVDWQIARRNNVDPNAMFRLPDLWKEMSVHDVSEAVHDEYPGKHQATLTAWLVTNKELKLDQNMFPFRSQSDFLGKVVRSAYLNSWAVAEVGPITFYTKWAVGRPRPEEIAFKIAQGELKVEDGVPRSIVKKIKAMNLTKAEAFTGYPEGSPKHPSWPAMHSAGSTSSFWLKILFELSEEQYCQALLTDYAVAMARTTAGVHYRMDNICGLNMGQQIIAERLADVLATKYGSDPVVVQAKIDQERFNWEDFDPLTCSRK